MRPASLFLKRKDLIDDQRDGAEAEPMQNPFLPAKVQTSVPEDQANQRACSKRETEDAAEHSLAERSPPGIALRRRSKTASGPRSFAIRWLSLKVASAPKTKMNQRTFLTRSLSAIRPARRDAKDFHRLQLVCACSGIVVRVS